MRAAAVGHQCVECVQAGAATVRAPRTVFGGRQRAGGTAVVTYTLIAVNIVMYIAQSASASLEGALVLWPPGVARDGEVWRIFTSAFLHYGPAHLLFNMVALWMIGPPLELWLGRSRFVALYILSALGGGVLVYLLAPLNSATAGASGAIFGLFGATFVVGKRLDLDVRGVIALIVINLAFTFVVPALSSQQISWQGHVGGLLTGALVAWIYAYAPRERRATVHVWASVALLALFVVLVWWRTSTLQPLFA
jgi:membrane associated rhomboid family serine protease